VSNEFVRLIQDKLDIGCVKGRCLISPGAVNHDRELWDLKLKAVTNIGYEDKVGFQVDVAAATYFDSDLNRYIGLFSDQEKTRDDLLRLYQHMVKNYPFVIIEDPLDEEDYEGHAILTRELGVEIVGDDLFTTNVDRLKKGIALGAANAVLLKVNQIGTITEAFDTVQLAYDNGYAVMPCDSRGEGALIADYAVGLGTGHLREGALGAHGNRFLAIEAELGSRAKFAGRKAIKGL
jgi:enolase